MSDSGRATLHLRVLGESRKVSVEVPPTPASVDDLLPAARAMTDATMAVALEKSAAAGAPASCRCGCDACCHQLVAVTPPEARALACLVNQMPAERQEVIRSRFAQTIAAARAAGILDPASPDGAPVLLLRKKEPGTNTYIDLARRYHRLRRPCAFLENGACGIYEHRPLMCREYVVSSAAEHCATLSTESIRMIAPPVRLSDGLSDIAGAVEGAPAAQIPLFAALAWAAANPGAQRNVSGVDLLKLLAKWVDRKSAVPLEQRGEGMKPVGGT